MFPYDKIIDPSNNKLYNLNSIAGKKILNRYISQIQLGGSSKTSNNILESHIISSTEFFEIDAFDNYYKQLEQQIFDLQKIFIETKINQDIDLVNKVRSLINLSPDNKI